jgi:hypothetical protein
MLHVPLTSESNSGTPENARSKEWKCIQITLYPFQTQNIAQNRHKSKVNATRTLRIAVWISLQNLVKYFCERANE